MNNLRNRVQLIGRLGRDPEIIKLESGKQLGKFSLATSEYYTDKEGKRIEDTQWHNLVTWGKQAEFAEKLLKKGKEVVVEGKLVTRNYDDKEGNKRFTTEIVVSEFLLVGPKTDD